MYLSTLSRQNVLVTKKKSIYRHQKQTLTHVPKIKLEPKKKDFDPV